jgi:DNA-binding transcriptional LysR family regulator
LIHRERHLTQLTELGKMILPTLEKIFAAAEAVRLQARGYQKKTIAPLKIGLVPSVSAALITELLLELARIIPDLRVDLREADANALFAMLLDGEINAALVGDAVELPERIDRWPLFEERCVLVLSRRHPMAGRTVIPLQDLHEVVFLERLGCDVAGRFKQACFADHPGPKVVHRSDQEGHLQQMASAGLGAILAPEHAPRLPSLTAIPIEGDPVRREVQLLAVAGRQYSPSLDAFIKVARVRDWTSALDKFRCTSAPASIEDNVRKADAQGAGALICTGSGPAASGLVRDPESGNRFSEKIMHKRRKSPESDSTSSIQTLGPSNSDKTASTVSIVAPVMESHPTHARRMIPRWSRT